MNTDKSEESEQVKILLPTGKIPQSGKQLLTRRMQQVFLALDEASAEGVTTYTALINFVRIKTGKGCSTRWVAKWKKQRAVELAQEYLLVPELKVEVPQQVYAPQSADLQVLPTKYLGTGVCITQTLGGRQLKESEGAVAWEEEVYSIQHKQLPASTDNPTELSLLKKLTSSDLSKIVIGARRLKVLSKLATVVAIGLSVVLAGGGRPVNTEQTLQPSITAQSNHTFSPFDPAAVQKQDIPKTLKLNLTISSPKDLKVREGDIVVAGEVIADRVEERSRLTTGLQALELEYKQLVTKTIPVPPSPVQVPALKSLPSTLR